MFTKKIWIYWQQGWQNAPILVKQCRESWERLNPEFEIHALDDESISRYVDIERVLDFSRRDLTVQKKAALLRLALLARYGGVWADATVMCGLPLGQWIDDHCESRFFAFRNPGKDRMMANWFIAAEPQSVILRRLYRSFLRFYTDNYFFNQGTVVGEKLLAHFSGRWNASAESTVKWHGWFARKVLRVYPYFIFHYTFNKLILEDPECAEEWKVAKPLSAGPPHRLQVLKLTAQDTEEAMGAARRVIDGGEAVVHKLDWRVDTSSRYWDFVLKSLRGVA